MTRELETALWAGDQERLQELAPCRCCCDEHTFQDCPARAWSGCRGQHSEEPDHEGWAALYGRERGMTRDEFFG